MTLTVSLNSHTYNNNNKQINKCGIYLSVVVFYVTKYHIVFNSNLTHKDFDTGISLMLPVAVIKYYIHNLLSWTYGSW